MLTNTCERREQGRRSGYEEPQALCSSESVSASPTGTSGTKISHGGGPRWAENPGPNTPPPPFSVTGWGQPGKSLASAQMLQQIPEARQLEAQLTALLAGSAFASWREIPAAHLHGCQRKASRLQAVGLQGGYRHKSQDLMF